MIHHGDCLDVMATFDAESIDAIVTDPPYGLGFMGKTWDHGVPGVPFWAEMLRVAKPGAHLLAFGGTRTVHRLATAIEDAGWEIRDTLVWAYASGFPKSLDVSKAIDKAAGAEREVLGHESRHINRPATERWSKSAVERDGYGLPGEEQGGGMFAITAPATPDAEKWQGWGTALKPAWEPIVMARKPLRGTVAANVLAHGTGALNIDGTRIATTEAERAWMEATARPNQETSGWGSNQGTSMRAPAGFSAPVQGRWPANVILTDPIFDGDTPGVVGGGEAGDFTRGRYAKPDRVADAAMFAGGRLDAGNTYGDSGTYSRFFLIPKAARSDREPVLGGLPENVHPTVKPVDLMRHLVRLVTPPGGIVLDPFLGSGTTALAAEMEGFEWVGIEKEAEYVAIAEARLNGTQRGMALQ
jgi:DNA modification methylase